MQVCRCKCCSGAKKKQKENGEMETGNWKMEKPNKKRKVSNEGV